MATGLTQWRAALAFPGEYGAPKPCETVERNGLRKHAIHGGRFVEGQVEASVKKWVVVSQAWPSAGAWKFRRHGAVTGWLRLFCDGRGSVHASGRSAGGLYNCGHFYMKMDVVERGPLA